MKSTISFNNYQILNMSLRCSYVIIFVIAFVLFVPIAAFAQEESEQKVCTAQYDPVCGIDDETYSNLCVLESAGSVFDYEGECVGTEPELKRKSVCGDGTIDVDGICQGVPIEEEKQVEKSVDTTVEKPTKKSVNWFSSFFDWLGSLFG